MKDPTPRGMQMNYTSAADEELEDSRVPGLNKVRVSDDSVTDSLSSINSRFALRLILISSLTLVSVGYHLSIVNSTLNIFVQLVNEEKSDRMSLASNLNFLYTFSAFVGAWVFSALMVNDAGRKTFMIATDIIMMTGSVCTFILAKHGWIFLVLGRVACGLSAGVNAILVPMYIREVLAFSKSPTLLLLRRFCTEIAFSIGIAIGMAIGALLYAGTPVNITIDTKILYTNGSLLLITLVPVLFPFFRSIALCLDQGAETPAYCLLQGEDEMAKKFFISMNHADEDNKVMKMKNDILGKVTETKMMRMCGEKFRKQLISAVLLMGLHISSGLIAFFLYSVAIFNYYRVLTKDDNYINIFQSNFYVAIIFLLALIMMFVLQKALRVPRRFFMITGASVAGAVALLSSISVFIGMIDMSVNLIYIYVFFAAFAYGPVIELYIDDVLPEKGSNITTIMKWLGYSTFGAFFEFIIRYTLMVPGFLMVMFLLNIFAIYIFADMIPETQGVAQDNIPSLFGLQQERFLKSTDKGSDSIINTEEK
jgi:MFS family permease